MRSILALIFVIGAYSAVASNDIFNYLKHDSLADSENGCDQYIESSSSKFEAGLRDVLRTYEVSDWALLDKLLSAYYSPNNPRVFMQNEFIKYVLDCSSVYKFNNDINYFSELHTTTYQFFSRIDNAIRTKDTDNDDIKEGYGFIVEYLEMIHNSQNKSANKLLNQTGVNNTPSG